MRYLGIDFGEGRIGIAVCDEQELVTRALTTLERKNDQTAIAEIVELARREKVGALVMGEPLGPGGRGGDAADRVRGFAAKLERAAEMPVHLIDETLTTREARARLRSSGTGRRRTRTRLDAAAARIILEDWLSRRRR